MSRAALAAFPRPALLVEKVLTLRIAVPGVGPPGWLSGGRLAPRAGGRSRMRVGGVVTPGGGAGAVGCSRIEARWSCRAPLAPTSWRGPR